ncbi:Endocuticle structural glycoprotein SgAbd-2 [Folsomia candida]|uniref:Endocuticle structural glycoprotein SgAbd-2 n=1 Tax=Folsomia candida TaxID=158441 RepID=A0A226DU17_FOLCA|nr:Endocuticle structural glycoprotein SgAbd-2 [Folsomia candida]
MRILLQNANPYKRGSKSCPEHHKSIFSHKPNLTQLLLIMKLFVFLTVCIASTCAASYGGYSTPEIRVTSYDAPAVKTASYSSYAAPEVKMASYSTYAAPELKKAPIPIVRFNLNDDNYGTFAFDHLSGDGTSVSEEGHLKSLPGDLEGPVSVMSGAYSFLGDDENGFRAVGDHLPTPPPVPVELIRAHAEAAAYPSYEAPLIRSSYSGYEAPIVRSSYSAPAIRIVSSGY